MDPKLRKYFALAAIAALVVLAVSPLKDFFREWRFYQMGYNRLVASLPQKVQPAEMGIKQIWYQKFDRVDRCMTCHLGLKVDALRDARQPYRTHPHIAHDIEDFSCTFCHEGQGAATEFKESVGRVKYWDSPILPNAYMEASCAKCHKERDVPEAPVLNSGRRLLEASNCVGCHKLPGYPRQWVPHLDGIGSKVSRQWLVGWLKDPKAYFAATRMPNFLLGGGEAGDLADFLMSSRSFADSVVLEPLPAELSSADEKEKAALVETGSTRFKEARCISCHQINGKGGSVATDLGRVASKVSEQWLYNYLKNPKRFSPGVQMPRYRFTGHDLAAVVAYMESEFVDYDLEKETPHTPDPAAEERGAALFEKFNCAGCHALGSMSKPTELGPDLTAIGSKKLYQIDFGKSGIEQTLPSYLTVKLLEPHAFSPAMKMPKFGFTREEAQAIAVALLGNIEEKVPDEFIVRPAPASTFAPQGQFGKLVDDLACMGCHLMQGRGHLVGTDLSLEASQAQQQWIEGYFKVPYSLRPILTERMPNFFLSDAEIKTLTGYMEEVFVADSLDHPVRTDPETVARGRGLYFEKYGCQACHQIESKGGYVGPPLDKLNERLKPGWVFHWLKNPQAYKPGSIEPNNNLSDQDAEALTAFLLTLK